MIADEIKKERDDLAEKLSRMGDLICALEVISWQIAQQPLEGEQATLRDAIVGISRSLAHEVELPA